MTVIPFPQPFSDNADQGSVASEDSVLVLKELIYNLQREQTKIQDLLSSLGFALRSFSNLNQFLELTPLMATRVTDALGGALILYEEGVKLKLEQFHCQDSDQARQLGRSLEKVLEKVNSKNIVSAKSPSLISSILDERIFQEFKNQLKVYGTPVIVRNVEQGRLFVFSEKDNYNWTPTRRKLVQLVADQTAVAIANHDLTVEVRSKERQDRELEIASDIQLRLLPTKCPQIDGLEIAAKCQTANRVGGDYYDFIPTNYDQICYQNEQIEASNVPWSIVIGDVMGKGVPAGLIMTMTRGMLRAEVLNRHSPAQIMQHLNRVMYADLENSHRFVSMFYSEYNPKTHQLSFTNAAHNPPLWWQENKQKLTKLDTWGMLIGLDIESDYEDDTVTLGSGDTVMYYTDGFTDAVNANGDRFDEENLFNDFQWACQNLTTTNEILDYLFERIEDFTGKSSSNKDDMTLIILKVS